MEKFSPNQLLKIEDLVEWVNFLKTEKEFTNRLKIWKRLRDDGVEGFLLLEAFRQTGLFDG